MKIFTDIRKLQKWSKERKCTGAKIALIPTMGYLHEGHLSLIKKAQAKGADEIIVSVFVNPVQFGPNEDYKKYPRDEKSDVSKCKLAGATAVFCPAASSMYLPRHSSFVTEEDLASGLCGARRPGHFRGVCTVVAKLFNITHPDFAVFGQKDYQQALVIRRMVRDLNYDIEVLISPIVRESTGLARSSRNIYLTDFEKHKALAISRSLQAVKEGKMSYDKIAGELKKAGLKVDYVECVDSETLKPAKKAVSGTCVLVAAYAGKTRLIDNVLIGR